MKFQISSSFFPVSVILRVPALELDMMSNALLPGKRGANEDRKGEVGTQKEKWVPERFGWGIE